jgi:thymidylate synthase (FAD)
MCVEIKTSRGIAAQILRHRSFSFQEFSQRYSIANEFEDIELRLQGDNNRQVGEILMNTNTDAYDKVNELLIESLSLSQHCYDTMIENGVAKEVARMILPLTTQTTMYMKGSLRSWIHYLDLRTEQNTQKEHRIIADKCKLIFTENFPIISEALQWKKN